MPRIIVMSEPNAEPESAITLDERVTPANLRSGHDSARLIERVGSRRFMTRTTWSARTETRVGPQSAQ